MRSRECAFLAWLLTLCAPLNLTTWVDSLSRGDRPEVPYAAGATLQLPGSVRVPLGSSEVEIVGATKRGTMLFVEGDGYVWVAPDGTATPQPERRWDGVQDAAVSPGGRWFARGREVVDLRDGSVVAELPEDAAVITGWVRGGLTYATSDGRLFVRPVAGRGFRLRPWVHFPGAAPVGLTSWHGCWSVVRVNDHDDRSRWPRVCRGPGALTVSPGAAWVVARDLAVRTVRGRLRGYLAGVPLEPVGPVAAYWVSGRDVLIALPDTGVVRCDVRALTCELTVGRTALLPLR